MKTTPTNSEIKKALSYHCGSLPAINQKNWALHHWPGPQDTRICLQLDSDHVWILISFRISINWNQSCIFFLFFNSDDFLKQTKGLVLLYSLKNPSYPEILYYTDSGVMSLDIHADYPNLIAVGFYDGTVGVYNTAESSPVPKYTSSAKNGKHTDPVWQVRDRSHSLRSHFVWRSIYW